MPSGRTNNYPESGRGLGHVTPTIFGIRSNISLKLLELETSNLIHGFVWAMPSRRIDNFPESRRGLRHVTLTIFGSTVGYPSDSLASCQTSYADFSAQNDRGAILLSALLLTMVVVAPAVAVVDKVEA